MLKEKEVVIRRAMIALDAFVITAVFLFSYYFGRNLHAFYIESNLPFANLVNPLPASINMYLIVLLLTVPLWCVMLYLNDTYSFIRTESPFEIIWPVIKAAAFMIVAFGAIVFLFQFKFVSRLFFATFMIFCTFALICEKAVIFYAIRSARKRGHNYRRFIVVGTGKRAVDFVSKIKKHPEWGFKIEGILDYEKHHVGKDIQGLKVIGTLDDLQNILCNKAIDEVVFIVPRAALGKIENALYVCENLGIRATLAVDFFDFKLARLRQTELDGLPLVSFETTVTDEFKLFIKRAFDIVSSFTGLIVLSPILLLTAIIIKMTSSGQVLFLQERAGFNGRQFTLYKFRTMHKDAHNERFSMEMLNEMYGPVFKIKNDPRVTLIGRFLRKLSIDELPQLFNVLMGHMSLIGPRPLPVYEVEKFEPWQRRRLSMRPGLTCLWQIRGRNKVDFNQWMKLDLEYIDTWSLRLDFYILIKTIPVVLFGIGAY